MAHRAGKSTSNGTSTHYSLGRVGQVRAHEVRGAGAPGSVWPTGYVRRYPGGHRVRAGGARRPDESPAGSVRSGPDRAGRGPQVWERTGPAPSGRTRASLAGNVAMAGRTRPAMMHETAGGDTARPAPREITGTGPRVTGAGRSRADQAGRAARRVRRR